MTYFKRDYTNFSSVCKSRFRGVAEHFGFEQVSGIIYLKRQVEFLQAFSISKNHRGGNTFKIIYGVKIPSDPSQNFTADIKRLSDQNQGIRPAFYNILVNGDGQRDEFSCRTKEHIENSARKVKIEFEKQALPWFDQFRSLSDLSKYHLKKTGHQLVFS